MAGFAYSPVFDEFGFEPTEEMRGRIESELSPGEKLLWASRSIPRANRSGPGLAIGRFLTAVLLGLTVWTGSLVVRNPDSNAMVSIYLMVSAELFVFFAIGLFAHACDRRAQTRRMSKTLYALTDRRAIFWKGHYRRGATEVVSITRGQVGKIHRLEYDDGSGDLMFSLVGGGGQDVQWGPTEFQGVSEVRRVEEQVRRVLMSGDATA